MREKTKVCKLKSPLYICFFFTLLFMATQQQAHAEYYLYYGGAPAMVELYGGPHYYKRHHAARHYESRKHYRGSYSISVVYFLQPSCCGAAYIAPPPEVDYYIPEYYVRDPAVFMAQPDMYSGSQINDEAYSYDPDMRTGDDYGANLDIDY